jgi:hypothetical protein
MTTTDNDIKQLVGAWRLTGFSGDDYAMRTRGSNSSGMVIYDATGVMSLQIMPDVAIRSPFAAKEPTPEEAKKAFTGYQAYFGTYSVDTVAKTVTHHLEGNLDPGQIDNRTRTYEFLGEDTLVLRINSRTLTWKRVK